MSCDYFALATPGVQGLSPYQAGKPIEELQRELGLEHIVKLASNENPLGPSSKALAAIAQASADIARYPDSNAFELKQVLAERLAVSPAQLTIGNGSNDVLDVIARVFLGPGKSAVFSQHAFIVYPLSVQATGARAIVSPAKNWGHDLDAMASAVEADTSLIFIANPNNPTGTVVSESELVSFLDKVPEQVLVVLDEAYIEYTEAGALPDGVSLLKRYPNLIVTRTFSKAWGLAALRVGYSIAAAEITDLLNRVRAPFNVNSLGLVAAQAVLTDEPYLQAGRETNRQGMQQLEAGFAELGLNFIPSSGNFIAVEMPVEPLQVYQQLLREGVIVRPVTVYEMSRHLRVSIGLGEQNQLFLSALKKVLKR